jgi:hypothetical protein
LNIEWNKRKSRRIGKQVKKIERYQGENSHLPIAGFLKNEKLNGSIEDIIDYGT